MGTDQRVYHAKSNLRPAPRKDEVGLGGVIFQFVTQGCLGKKRKVKRRAFHLQEITTIHHQRLNHSKASVSPAARAPVTLAEWIMDSPSWSTSEGNRLLQVSKPRRVHPSVLNKMKKSGDHEDDLSFSTMNRSGTFKKKVSFKEPEVADVFILKSSPEN